MAISIIHKVRLMKALTKIFGMAIMLGGSYCLGAGSAIKNSSITNQARVKNSANLAISAGAGRAEANQASIRVKGANLTNATVINRATVSNSANVAIAAGGRAEANQGAVVIKKSLNGVTIVNDSNISNSANIAVDAMGLGSLLGTNESSQGSVIIK